jgi:hypothetical protein
MQFLDNLLIKLPLILNRIPRPLLYLLSLAFVAIILKVHPYDGSDFRWYWSLGRAMIDGSNPFLMSELNKITVLHPVPFDFVIMPYPASTGLVLLPFALITFSTSAYLFKAISTCVLLIGSIRCAQKLQPAAITTTTIFPITVLLFLWSPVRWAASNLQLITLIAGLYGIFISIPPRKVDKWRITIAIVVVCLKFTAVIPFVIIFLLQKRWISSVVTIVVGSSLVLGSFIRTGMPNSLLDYIDNLREFSRFENPVDAVSPYVRDAGIRLDLSYFINGFCINLPYVSYLSIVLTVLMVILVLRFGSGDFKSDHGKLSLVTITGIGLLWTYQHVYAWVIFVPVFAMLICETTWLRLTSTMRFIVLLILVYGFTTATNVTTSFLRKHIGEFAVIVFRTYPSCLLVALTVTALTYTWIANCKSKEQVQSI